MFGRSRTQPLPLASPALPARDGLPQANAPALPTDDPTKPLDQRVIAVLRTVRDPEIPVNIYDLGLVYGVDVSPEGDVHVRMTLTTPACPVAGSLPPAVERKLRALAGVRDVKVELVWDPPWSRDRLSDAAKLQLGLL